MRSAPRWLWCLLLATGLAAATSDVHALRKVEPGERPTLRDNEGLLVIAMDSNDAVESLTVRRGDKLFDGGRVKDIAAGITFQLFVAEEGEYRWDGIRWYNSVRFDLTDLPGYRFKVERGRINYPGDLIFRPSGFHRANLHVANRGLRVLEWLAATHADLPQDLPFAYSGRYPDPFPAYRATLGAPVATAAATTDIGMEAVAPEALPIPVEVLWRPSNVVQGELDAAGELLALVVRTDEGRYGVDVVDLRLSAAVRVLEVRSPVSDLHWAGPRVLLASVGTGYLQKRVNVFRLWTDPVADTSSLDFEHAILPRLGSVVDPLPADRNAILFASPSRDQVSVHRLDISSKKTIDRLSFKRKQRLNTGVDGDRLWLTDGSGRLRLALAQQEDEWVLMHENAGTFAKVVDEERMPEFVPVALSPDGMRLYGLTDHERSQRDLVALDLPDGEPVTLFSKPGIDTVAPVLDARGEFAGALYFEHGQLATEFVGAADQRMLASLKKAFGGQGVLVLDRDKAGRHYIVAVDSVSSPGRIYHFDAKERRAELVEESAPWLADYTLRASELVNVVAPDGTAIEAFLTLPAEKAAPLVVMPHGGPIGIRDDRHFDPQVQFLVSLGYAVLQVNFRGSEGYGRAFREAGMGMVGSGMEDDINAAVEAVLSRGVVDGKRLCALGTSYGGYSALMLAIRWPERYRCVVSIAGLTDLPLHFTATDGARHDETRAFLEKLLGDPHTQMDALRNASPVYRAAELKAPVLLVHGEEDLRVDFEHARRLQDMLTRLGRPPQLIALAREGHGIDAMENVDHAWRHIAGFLRQHLVTGQVRVEARAAPLP